MTVRGHQYERRGLLAVDPKAFLEVFFCDDAPRENQEIDGCVLVDVRGPLEQHMHPWCDSYESVIARVRAACETGARAVIMRFDSPGGEAAGCFDAALELRAIAAAAGKQLHAYVEGDCCSAAYALACASQSITMSNSSLIGSVGVLSCRNDYSAANAAMGLRVALIASGVRKADGHPDQPLGEAELASTQAIVDSMAAVFFELVASARNTTTEAVSALQAKVFHGQQAVSVGLADEVGPLTTVLARIAGVANGDTTMAVSAYEKARDLLQEAAKGDDANAAAAKAALAAMGIGGDDDEPAGDEPPADPAKKPPVADDPPKDPVADAEPKDAQALAAAAYKIAITTARENATLRAEIKKRDEQAERRELIASRPNLAPEMVALLEKAPMQLVRETIAETPAPDPKGPHGAQLVRAPIRGNTQVDGAHQVPAQPADAKAAMDNRMGIISANKATVVNTEYTQKLGVHQPSAPGAKN